jgi:ubiquinone/menaquinone biosynthesis C-methylase UbiE
VGLYRRLVLPRILDFVMRNDDLTAHRADLIPRATGSVLEIGIGSGLNLPFYPPTVTRLWGVDPSAELLAMAQRKLDLLSFPVELLCQPAEQLSLERGSIDTVVTTWVLCSIPDPLAALREVKRVLKPGGRFLFVEHGASPDAGVQAWQRRLNPIWKRIAGGCNLDRRIEHLIRSAGFDIAQLQNSYLPGPRPFTYTYEGLAGH